MKQFIDDMIHMTEGEKFIAYWPLWLGIVLFAALVIYVLNRRKGR